MKALANPRRKGYYETMRSALIVAFLLASQLACRTNEQIIYSVPSPDGVNVANVGYTAKLFKPRRLLIEIRHDAKSKIVYNPPKEFVLTFAEVYWSPDSNIVGVLARTDYTRQPIIVGYNVAEGVPVAASKVETPLRRVIRQNYPSIFRFNQPDSVDPIEWTQERKATQAFSKRLSPEARSVY